MLSRIEIQAQLKAAVVVRTGISNVATLKRTRLYRPNVAARKIVLRDGRVARCGRHFASVTTNIARATQSRGCSIGLLSSAQQSRQILRASW